MKLSIIIPHYNTFELITNLLINLSNQDREDIEVIIIDDSQEERLDKFKILFNNFTLIHNPDRVGVSKARNQGIAKAKGKYIAFIDSDDQISEDYINVLIKEIEKGRDVITFAWFDLTTKRVHRNPSNYAVWKAIYKKEIVPRFNNKLRHKEDVEFQAELNEKAYTLCYVDKILYYYNSHREGSLYWEEKKGIE